jgi:hypothetical protein
MEYTEAGGVGQEQLEQVRSRETRPRAGGIGKEQVG